MKQRLVLQSPLLLAFVFETGSQCSPGYPQNHRNLPVFASPVLGLKLCHHAQPRLHCCQMPLKLWLVIKPSVTKLGKCQLQMVSSASAVHPSGLALPSLSFLLLPAAFVAKTVTFVSASLVLGALILP